jgi:hypothetical protein
MFCSASSNGEKTETALDNPPEITHKMKRRPATNLTLKATFREDNFSGHGFKEHQPA